jgi:rod shape-determining protein MreD
MMLTSAAACRLNVAHIMPDWPVLVLVFLGIRRDPVGLCAVAVALGYLVDRQALAPVGLHEVSLTVCAMTVYMVSGHLVGSGAIFFAMITTCAVTLHHLLVLALLWWQRGAAGFSSWATALLLPDALATAFVALCLYSPMVWLERRLTQDRREGLVWRA